MRVDRDLSDDELAGLHALLAARAEALSDRRQSMTSVFSSVLVAVVAVNVALASLLRRTAESALFVAVLAVAACMVATLWLRALIWYRNACSYWYARVRRLEAGRREGLRPFTEEYAVLYGAGRSPTSYDVALASVFCGGYGAEALVAIAIWIHRT